MSNPVNETPTALVPSTPAQPAVNNISSSSSDEVEIDLVEVFYLLWSKLFFIILFFVLGAVVAFAATFFLVTPMYSATSRMYILSSSSNSVVNLSDLQISSNLKADYKELLTSRELLEEVVEDLNLDYTYDQLAKLITISNPTDTRILNVTATTPSPQLSADIANELANQAKIYLPGIMKSEEPSVFEAAVVPTKKSSPSYMKNTLIGGLLLSLLYCAIVIVRYLMNDTLVTPDDVYDAFGIQPLATIPEGDLSGAKPVK